MCATILLWRNTHLNKKTFQKLEDIAEHTVNLTNTVVSKYLEGGDDAYKKIRLDMIVINVLRMATLIGVMDKIKKPSKNIRKAS